MTLILITLLALVPASLVLLIVLGYTVGKLKKQASFVQQETIEFIVAGTTEEAKHEDDKDDSKKKEEPESRPGGTLVGTLVNTKGYRYYDYSEPIPYDITVGVPKMKKGKAPDDLEKLDTAIKALELKLEGKLEENEDRDALTQEYETLVEQLSRRTFEQEYVPVIKTVDVHHAIVPKEMLERILKGHIARRVEKAKKASKVIYPADPAELALAKAERQQAYVKGLLTDDKHIELVKAEKQQAYVEGLLTDEINLDSFRAWWKLINDTLSSEKTKGEIWDDVRSKIKRWLQQRWGFFWVSIVHPARRIHEFLIVHSWLPDKKYSQGGQPDKGPNRLKNLIRVKTKPTKFLLRQPPRPVLIEGIEFADRFQGDVILYATFRVVMPYPAVFVWKEKFYEAIESALSSAFIDFARQVKWVDFVKKVKKGPGSGLHLKFLSGINIRTTTRIEDKKRTSVKLGGKGIVETVGIELFDVWIHDYEGHEGEIDEKTVAGALRAQELARLQGEAKIMEQTKAGEALLAFARRQKQAIDLVGDAEAAVLIKKAAAGKELAVAEQHVKALTALTGKDSKVQTYVEGGGSAGLMLPPNS